jgi:hypothetical protein
MLADYWIKRARYQFPKGKNPQNLPTRTARNCCHPPLQSKLAEHLMLLRLKMRRPATALYSRSSIPPPAAGKLAQARGSAQCRAPAAARPWAGRVDVEANPSHALAAAGAGAARALGGGRMRTSAPESPHRLVRTVSKITANQPWFANIAADTHLIRVTTTKLQPAPPRSRRALTRPRPGQPPPLNHGQLRRP